MSHTETAKRALTSASAASWGLGRISHKALTLTPYVYDTSAGSGVCAYVIDTGILTTHTVSSCPSKASVREDSTAD